MKFIWALAGDSEYTVFPLFPVRLIARHREGVARVVVDAEVVLEQNPGVVAIEMERERGHGVAVTVVKPASVAPSCRHVVTGATTVRHQ